MIGPKEKLLYGLLVPTLFSGGLFLFPTPVSSMEALTELMKASDADSFYVCDILTEEVKNTKNKLVMDKQSGTKLYQRGYNENKSIVSFSFSTTLLKEGQKSDPFNPIIEQYDKSSYIMNNLEFEFKEKYLPTDLAHPARKTRIDYHASEYFDDLEEEKSEDDIEKKLKRQLNSVYSGPEILEIGSYKKRKLDEDYTLSEAMHNLIHNTDYDLTIVFSYQDGTREFTLNLKTDKSADAVAKIPLNAERIPQESDKFFLKLKEWLEATLTTKSKILGGKVHKQDHNMHS